MKKPQALKDIEVMDYTIPRTMTPENGEEHDYSKGEPKILDEKYCMHVYSHQLRILIKEWIAYIESKEKKFVRKMTRESWKWHKEYEQGMHQNEYDSYAVWLGSVKNIFHKERAQVKILRKIFDIEN